MVSDEPARERIDSLRRERNAVILAHTYQAAEIQDIADFVGDSYGLSVEAARTTADLIVFCGVRFMAETAALLNPARRVVLAEPSAGCPMADMIDAGELAALKQRYPGATVICYVNSSADVKALADICCTSSNAVAIVKRLPPAAGIIFVPDKHLGSFVQERTGRRMVLWDGWCPTHARITPEMVRQARREHPRACLMIHPEAPAESRALADQVLSTGQMCTFVKNDTHGEYIVATEIGVLHTLRKSNPAASFFPVSTQVTCPNMRKGSLGSVADALDGTGGLRISIPETVAEPARRALRRMLELAP
jgi:quinolinate synthase